MVQPHLVAAFSGGADTSAGSVHQNGAPLRSELFSVDQLKVHARTLAGWHRIAAVAGPDLLLARMNENERVLIHAHGQVSSAVAKGRQVSPASEWLIDNFYLIQEQIRTARAAPAEALQPRTAAACGGAGAGISAGLSHGAGVDRTSGRADRRGDADEFRANRTS